jgi:phytoene dehydrogenase-like protein
VNSPDVLIVGGGLAGLCCARRLGQAGVACQILEASDDVGGRVRTDEVDGFLLDRGFQVFLTAYPEARQVLDYRALQLQTFEPGALIRSDGRFHRWVDPWRRPRHLLATAVSPVASLSDKLRVARLRRRVTSAPMTQLHRQPEMATIERLRREGFSDRIIERFFRPFLGGVFLESDLASSSRKFEFVFRMFAQGDAALPARGMQAIPRQITAQLPAQTVRTNSPVKSLHRGGVLLASGEELRAKAIVVATEAPAAAKLLGDVGSPESNGVTCLYFGAERPPLEEPILVLNGEANGPINNLCVPSQIAPAYAPGGQALVSATVIGHQGPEEQGLVLRVREQLADWFGPLAHQWQHLRTYDIPNALPHQPSLDPIEKAVRRTDGIFVCGDYLDFASIQGAMATGRRAAESVLDHLRNST